DELINAGAEIDTTSITGMSALAYAAWHNSNRSITSRLLAHGASIHSTDEKGQTPLMYAAAANPNVEVVKLLLQAGSDSDRKNLEGYSAREFVQMNPNKESIAPLFK
ncbi:MAG: ankyrin repeat domain-containing protein, partial [Sphaerochaeta sp.]|nr:ankyrin repeat domain-containing protein [Sphaerochaeta sp.]